MGSIIVMEVQALYRGPVATHTEYFPHSGLLLLRWRWQVPQKHYCSCIKLHEVTSQTTAIFVLTCNLVVIPLVPFFFNLHSGGWNQGPLDTAVT
jgi:hypothetical protein